MSDLPLTTVALTKSIALGNIATTLAAVALTNEERRAMAEMLKQHALELREAALRETTDTARSREEHK